MKDKEWAQRKVDKYLSYEGVLEARNALIFAKGVIDQLDEPEVKKLDKKIRELESYNDELIRDNNQLRNALDNQEVLSQEWIDEHEQCITGHGADKNGMTKYHHAPFVSVCDLQNLLVPKQGKPEKTVIPQKIADFIEKSKGKSHSLAYAINSTEAIKWFSEKHRDEWLYSNERENLFAHAWLDGYEVEKGKLYTVDLPHYYELIKLSHTQTYRIKKYSESGFGDHTNTFTEAEIKSIDERYWAFANEVLQ